MGDIIKRRGTFRDVPDDSIVFPSEWADAIGDTRAVIEIHSKLKAGEYGRFYAFMMGNYSLPDICKMLGVGKGGVITSAQKFVPTVRALRRIRTDTLRSMVQDKALELIRGMDVSQIPEEKKAQAFAQLAKGMGDFHCVQHSEDKGGGGGDRGDDVTELIFQVRKTMNRIQPGGNNDEARAVDNREDDAIEGECKEIKEDGIEDGNGCVSGQV